MRERFRSVSDRIAVQLAQLEWQIDRAPPALRASIGSAAQEIAAAQARLRAQMERLPTDPEQRYHIMRSLLQAQFAALEHLGAIVGQLAAQPWPTTMPFPSHAQPAGGLAGPAVAPNAWPPGHTGPAPSPAPSGAIPGAISESEQAIAARLEHLLHGEPPAAVPYAPAQQGWYGGSMPAAGAAGIFSHSDVDALDEDEAAAKARRPTRSTLPAIYSRRLVAMVAVAGALTFAYVAFPRPSESDSIVQKAMAEKKGRRVAIGDPAAAITSPQQPAFDRAPFQFPPFAAVPTAPPMAQPPLIETTRTPPIPRMLSSAANEPAGARDDANPPVTLSPVTNDPEPGNSRLRQRQAAVQSEAAPPVQTDPPPPSPPRFVPVVFTHQDRAAALETFAELKKQFPAVVGSRKGEVQKVDLGEKGIWHRLVVLPAGSRQRADALCEQLKTAGYDRCWVKAY